MAFCPPVNRLGPGTGWVYNWNHDSAVIQPAVLSRRSGNTDHIFTDEHSWAQDIVALDPRFRRKPRLEAETIAKIPKRGIVRGIDKPLVFGLRQIDPCPPGKSVSRRNGQKHLGIKEKLVFEFILGVDDLPCRGNIKISVLARER